MEERKIESLDEAIDELLSLGYLQYVEPDKLLEVTEAESPHGTGGHRTLGKGNVVCRVKNNEPR